MKPNPLPRKNPQSPPPAAVDPGVALRLRQLIQRQAEIETALRETQAERASGQLLKAVDTDTESLLNFATALPPAGPEKTVLVRTVGLLRKSHQATERVPLEGLTVRLRIGENEIAAEKTGPQGIAVLRLPEGKAVAYEVEALDPRCQVIACEHGKLSDKHGAAHLLEVEEGKGLAAAFERAQPWLEAAGATSLRAAALKKTVATALERQETELKAMLSEVNALLAQPSPPSRKAEADASAEVKPTSTQPGGAHA
jgi:hypothetical protein